MKNGGRLWYEPPPLLAQSDVEVAGDAVVVQPEGRQLVAGGVSRRSLGVTVDEP